jgi:5-dehydro-2-deoxygluconokinase
MRVFAFDHRMQLEDLPGATPEKIAAFKALPRRRARGRGGATGLRHPLRRRLGRDALWRAAGTGLWIGRPVEWPGSRPLTLEPELGPDSGGLRNGRSNTWSRCSASATRTTTPRLGRAGGDVLRLFHAARRNRLEFLLEVIPSKAGPSMTTPPPGHPALLRHRRLPRLVEAGADADRRRLGRRLRGHRGERPHTRGIVVLAGLARPRRTLAASFAAPRSIRS